MIHAHATSDAPVFRRPRPDDAVDLALATFLQASRVDMQALATRLDVSPATLYRWFGSRAQLLDRVVGRLAESFADDARRQASGDGDDRVCDFARRMMVETSSFAPLRAFVDREPQLALRLLLGKEGSAHRILTDEARSMIASTRAPDETELIDRHVHMIVQVSTALVWATFTIGDEPEVDSAVEVIRLVLGSTRGLPAAG